MANSTAEQQKDKVLPLIDPFAVAEWDRDSDLAEAVAEAVREVNWQRVEPLIRALKRIRDSQDNDAVRYAQFCLDEATEALKGVGL